MATHSSIYSRCPSCHQDGLVQAVQDTYRCAACNFDYRTLASDTAAREAWMLENLRLGGTFLLFVMHLHRMILALPVQESNDRVIAFAKQHGIELPTGKPPNGMKILGIAIGVVILFGIAVAVIALAGQ